MSSLKIPLAVYAHVHPHAPDQIEFLICQHYHKSVEAGQLIPASEYDNGTITLVLEVFEIERDISAHEHLKAADVAVPGLKAKMLQLKADFNKAVTEVNSQLQKYLALPNGAEK